VSIGGTDVAVGENGILEVPDRLKDAVFPITAPGVVFSPATLDLTKGAPPVTTISVVQQPVTASGRSVQARFVDQANAPFAGRRVSILLPSGEEIQATTDENGYFDAPTGSQVYATDDEWGMATEPLLIS
jgi:hypothetical protein